MANETAAPTVVVDENTGETGKAYKISDLVTFEIAYPKDYKKTKHFKDGAKVKLHRLTAETFLEKGIGKIVAQ
jgi:hypothetical protein